MRSQIQFLAEAKTLGDVFSSIQALVDKVSSTCAHKLARYHGYKKEKRVLGLGDDIALGRKVAH